jgi:hypothetical protein
MSKVTLKFCSSLQTLYTRGSCLPPNLSVIHIFHQFLLTPAHSTKVPHEKLYGCFIGYRIGACKCVEDGMGQKMAQAGCPHHTLERVHNDAYRHLFGKTKGTEETFSKDIKAWYNTTTDRQFKGLNVIKETHSPMLQEMRRKTIDVIRRCLRPENSIGMRGDYRQAAELTLVSHLFSVFTKIVALQVRK